MIHGEQALCSDGGILPIDSRKQHDRNAMEASSYDPSAGDLVNKSMVLTAKFGIY